MHPVETGSSPRENLKFESDQKLQDNNDLVGCQVSLKAAFSGGGEKTHF
jgi:hypothetical protein